jgi:hypothetical protein
MIATAGLIGLGANFWFNVFRAMASFAVQMAPYNRAVAAYIHQPTQSPKEKTGEVRRPKEVKGSLASPGEEPDLDLLTDAFLTVSGKDTLGMSVSDIQTISTTSSSGGAPAIPSRSGDLVIGEMPSRPGPSSKAKAPTGIRKFRS